MQIPSAAQTCAPRAPVTSLAAPGHEVAGVRDVAVAEPISVEFEKVGCKCILEKVQVFQHNFEKIFQPLQFLSKIYYCFKALV